MLTPVGEAAVTVTCPTGGVVLEAFLDVTQQGNESSFAFFQPVCDGTPHDFIVRAEAVDFVFQRGKARVSTLLLLESGETPKPASPRRRGQVQP